MCRIFLLWKIQLFLVSIVTWDAGVGSLEISHEVLSAGLELDEFWIKNPDGAGAASRTLGIGIGQNIGIATDEVAGWQATSDPHTSVACRLHHDDASVRTGRIERFQVTDLPGFCCMWRKVQNELAPGVIHMELKYMWNLWKLFIIQSYWVKTKKNDKYQRIR